MITFELFGQTANAITAHEQLFDATARTMGLLHGTRGALTCAGATAALAIAAASVAVGAASGSAHGQDDGPGDEAAAVVAGLVDASPYPPLSRLGRWDGTSFVSVDAGSIDTPQVVVISHGWEPGLREPYDRLQAASDSLVTVWDPQLVDCQRRVRR